MLHDVQTRQLAGQTMLYTAVVGGARTASAMVGELYHGAFARKGTLLTGSGIAYT